MNLYSAAMNPAFAYALRVLLNWLVLLGPVVPLAAIAVLATKRSTAPATERRPYGLLALVAALFLLDLACLLAPRLAVIPPGMNWQGKVLECIWVIAFAATGLGGSFSALGLGWQPEPRDRVWPALAIATLLALCFPAYGLFIGARLPTDAATVIYELTLPGLAEEMVFRGVFQSLFNQVFGRPWKLLGAQVGWGFILSTAMFTIGHGMLFSKSLHLQTSFVGMLPALYAGLILGWMRERAGSIWPGVVVHNATNIVIVIGSMFL